MPRSFGTMRMTTTSELLYGALFFLIALIARSVSLSMSVGFLRDMVSMLSVVMLIGGVVVIDLFAHDLRRRKPAGHRTFTKMRVLEGAEKPA